MQIIRQHAFARAGLIGNPSDGFHGKTISLSVPQFRADVVLYDWPTLEILWSQEDHSRFQSVRELTEDVRLHGYYGGVRLVKATIRRFVDYCDQQGHALHERNFSIRYRSSIPRQVGMAGSSAIVIATLRALMQFYEVNIPQIVQPSLALSVETGELGINAGLQDRVIQVYEGMVSMDFSQDRMQTIHGLECGTYEPLDPQLLPPLYLAYSTEVSEPTEITHTPMRTLFDQGDTAVVAAMQKFADLATRARRALLDGDHATLGQLIDENFDTRQRICNLAPRQIEMVQRARSCGASAKFPGSGGAIIGTYTDATMYQSLCRELGEIGCEVIPLADNRESDQQ